MDLSRWWTDAVAVQPLQGGGSLGPTWAAAVSFLGYVVGGRKLVLDDQAQDVVAEMTVWCPPALPGVPDTAASFKPGSLVTLADNLPHRVITSKPFTRFGAVEYVELTTT